MKKAGNSKFQFGKTNVKNQNKDNIKSEDSKKTTETNNRKKEKKSFITRMQISFKN